MVWTSFMDMHSGGGSKEKWEYIYIEAPEDEAKIVFYKRFGHNPERVSCTCCGSDYSTNESEDLAQATAFNRNCDYKDGRYVERQESRKIDIRRRCSTPDSDRWGLYQTVEQYCQNPDILLIRANEIKPDERKGRVPRQGYVWCD